MAPMKRSRIARMRLTIAARGSPACSRACIRAREAAVNAVSAPAKKAESRSEITTMLAANHRSISVSIGSVRPASNGDSAVHIAARAAYCAPIRRTVHVAQ